MNIVFSEEKTQAVTVEAYLLESCFLAVPRNVTLSLVYSMTYLVEFQ